MITIRDLVPGKSYNLQFRSRNGDSYSPWSDAKNITVSSDILAPAAVTGLSVSVSGTSFVARWNNVTTNTNGTTLVDFQDYVVYVTDGADVEVFYTASNFFTLGFEENRAAFGGPKGNVGFAVVARDKNKNTVVTPAYVYAQNPIPGLPTGVTALSVSDGVSLKWNAPADTDLKRYNVYADGALVGTPTSTSFLFASKTYGTPVSFRIASVDVFDQMSAQTTAVTGTPVNNATVADTTPPANPVWFTPAYTTANKFNGRGQYAEAYLRWNANADADLAGYIVQHKPASGTVWTEERTVNTTMLVSTLPLATPYNFRLAAYDKSNNVSAFVNIPGTPITFTDTTPPGKPAGFTTAVRLGVVTINWTGVDSTGAVMPPDFAYAKIVDNNGTGFERGRWTGPGGKLIISDLNYNITYQFKVTAYDISGNASVASDTITVIVTPLVNTDIIGEVVGNANLIDGAVTNDKLVDGVINPIKLATNAVTTDKLATGAVSVDKVAANAVTADKIAANAVTTGKIDALAVTADKVAANAVTADKVAANAVTADKIAANSVNASKILAGSIDTTRLQVGQSNLIVDPFFINTALKTIRLADSTTGATTGWFFDSTTAIQRIAGSTVARMVTGSGNKYIHMNTTNDLALRGSIPVTPGTKLRIAVWVDTEAGWTGSLRPFFDIRFVDGSLETRNTTDFPTTAFIQPGQVWTRYTWETIVPDNVAGVDLGFYCSSTSSGTLYLTEPDLRLMTSGVLIEDGAVTAGKIAALAIEAGKIQANAITSDKILAGSVTATKLEAILVMLNKLIAGNPSAARVEMGLLSTGVNGLRVIASDGTTILVDMTNGKAIFRGTVEAAAFSTRIAGTGGNSIRMGPDILGPTNDSPAVAWDMGNTGVDYVDPHIRVSPSGQMLIQGNAINVGTSEIKLGTTDGQSQIELNAVAVNDSASNAKIRLDVADGQARGWAYVNRIKVGSAPDHGYNALSRRAVLTSSLPANTWVTQAFTNTIVQAEDDGVMNATTSTVYIPRTGWYDVLHVSTVNIGSGAALYARVIDQGGNVLLTASAEAPLQTVTLSGPLYAATGVEIRFQLFQTDSVTRTVQADGGVTPNRFAVVGRH